MNTFGGMVKNCSRILFNRLFIAGRHVLLLIAAGILFSESTHSQPVSIIDKDDRFEWLQTARVFLMDAYQPPFAPELEFDANFLAETMVDMNANVVRISTMGKYATIQGVRFTRHPMQGNRDLLTETIEACKPRGIKVIPYISTGHKLAWSMVTKDYPEYGQKTSPDGAPDRQHMFVGEDHGTVCWMTAYRKAYLDLVEHVVRDYDIDGIYFDAWMPFYFWQGKQLCYCNGCRNGFRNATGLEIPYHENDEDYNDEELKVIDKYHHWYIEEYIAKVVLPVRDLVKSYKDIPLISNINNPEKMVSLDPRIINSMDAFLYERGHSILERAEGVGVPRSVGLHIWPYVGTYHNWPRLVFQGINYQQEIFTNLMFGGGSIIAQPTGYIFQTENRDYVKNPFGLIKKYEKVLEGQESYPYVGVVFAYDSPKDMIRESWNDGVVNARTSTLGAFSACLYNHIQVGSISELVLDDPAKLKRYPILYLANIPSISGERIKNITEYVKNGGCLITSYEATLFDTNGVRINQFGLESLLKVRPIKPKGELADIVTSYQSMTGGPNDLYLSLTKDNKVMAGEKLKRNLYPLWFYEPVEVLEGGQVLMDIVTGPDKNPILPGVVMSNYGMGRVIYCASALESFYQSGGQDLVGELIQKFVEIVAKESAPYHLDAPAGLIANMTRKDDQLVFHMTNWTGDKFEQPLRNAYYLAPVENVRLQIVIPENKKFKEVYTLVETEYKKKINGQTLNLFFPRIGYYQAVVVDLK
jgi:hypothetical protein